MNNVIRKNGRIYRDCERSILDWIDNINPADYEVADIFIDGDCDFELGDDFVRGLKDTWVI